jgi:hypothetical protein
MDTRSIRDLLLPATLLVVAFTLALADRRSERTIASEAASADAVQTASVLCTAVASAAKRKHERGMTVVMSDLDSWIDHCESVTADDQRRAQRHSAFAVEENILQ